jgi:hypothetical protein
VSEPFSWALDAEALCDRFLRFHVFRHGWGLCTCGEKEWPGEDFDPRDPEVNPIGAAKARGRADLVIDLDSCGRCHESHPGLELRTFSYPADTGRGIIFTHWALCPVNGEPILHASGVIYPAPLVQGKEPEE